MYHRDMCSQVSLGLKQDLEAALELRDHSLQTLNTEKPSLLLNRPLK